MGIPDGSWVPESGWNYLPTCLWVTAEESLVKGLGSEEDFGVAVEQLFELLVSANGILQRHFMGDNPGRAGLAADDEVGSSRS